MVFVDLVEDTLNCHGSISGPEIVVTALARRVIKNTKSASVMS